MKKFMKNGSDSNYSTKSSYTEGVNESTLSRSLENTNDILFTHLNEFVLNKKLVKINQIPQKKKSSKKTFSLKPKIYSEEYDEINMDKWFRNRIKISLDEKNPKKKIFKLYSDDKNKSHSNQFLLWVEKERGSYVVRNNEGIVAKLRWNIFSNHFKVFDDKDNLIEEIIYNFNFKGWNGPTKLTILIPKTPGRKSSYSKNKNRHILHKMNNKFPEYNEIFHTYVLNFLRRPGIIPNERNIQVINSEFKEDSNNILLQFAQTNLNEFILDYKYPYNKITAFALAVTLLSSRTFCN